MNLLFSFAYLFVNLPYLLSFHSDLSRYTLYNQVEARSASLSPPYLSFPVKTRSSISAIRKWQAQEKLCRLSSSAVIEVEKRNTYSERDLVTVILPSSELSPFVMKPERTPVAWKDVFKQVSDKVKWEILNEKYDPYLNQSIGIRIITADELTQTSDKASSMKAITSAILILVGLKEENNAIKCVVKDSVAHSKVSFIII